MRGCGPSLEEGVGVRTQCGRSWYGQRITPHRALAAGTGAAGIAQINMKRKVASSTAVAAAAAAAAGGAAAGGGGGGSRKALTEDEELAMAIAMSMERGEWGQGRG